MPRDLINISKSLFKFARNFNLYKVSYVNVKCLETHLKYSHYACKYCRNFHPLLQAEEFRRKGTNKIWSQWCSKNNKRHVKHVDAKMFALYLIRKKNRAERVDWQIPCNNLLKKQVFQNNFIIFYCKITLRYLHILVYLFYRNRVDCSQVDTPPDLTDMYVAAATWKNAQGTRRILAPYILYICIYIYMVHIHVMKSWKYKTGSQPAKHSPYTQK